MPAGWDFDMRSEPDPYRIILTALPVLVLAAYGWVTWQTYAEFFNWRLEFQRPAMPLAPEDVLGLGFMVPWTVFAVLFLLTLLPSLLAVRKRWWFAGIMVALFGGLSALDLHLYLSLIDHLLQGR